MSRSKLLGVVAAVVGVALALVVVVVFDSPTSVYILFGIMLVFLAPAVLGGRRKRP